MRSFLVGVVLLSCVGCKHLQKKTVDGVIVKKVEVVEAKAVEKERTRSVTIQIMPIQNLSISAL